MPYNTWTHIATTWDGSIIRHYIDGSLNWTDTQTSSGTNQPFVSIAGYSSRKFKGILDEVRIYNEAISSSQIRKNYYAGLERLLAKGEINGEEYKEKLVKK